MVVLLIVLMQLMTLEKFLNIESYSASENVAELTARINDDGWNTSYKNWLMVNNLGKKDSIFIFSVGGGDSKKS